MNIYFEGDDVRISTLGDNEIKELIDGYKQFGPKTKSASLVTKDTTDDTVQEKGVFGAKADEALQELGGSISSNDLRLVSRGEGEYYSLYNKAAQTTIGNKYLLDFCIP